jgi:hypothetical protein
MPERMEAQLLNAQDDNVAPAHPAGSVQGPSRVEVDEETDIDVKIMEEGEEGESTRPVQATVKGQSDLTPMTYRIGRSRVIEADLNKYVEQGLLKSTLRGLCHTSGMKRCSAWSLMKPSFFIISLKLDSDFHVRIL